MPTTAELEQVIVDNLGLARAYGCKFGRGHDDPAQIDELIAAGTVGLVRAAQRWDPARGPFRPFASTWVHGEIMHELRVRHRHAPYTDPLPDSVELPCEELGFERVDGSEVSWLPGLLASLTPSERAVFDCLPGPDSVIADRLGCSRQNVHNHVRAIRAKTRLAYISAAE